MNPKEQKDLISLIDFDSIIEDDANSRGRITSLAYIEDEAVSFTTDVLYEFDIPGVETITLGYLRGFEDVQKDLNTINATISLNASLYSYSGHKIHFEILLPIYKGEFQRPTIMRYNRKMYSLSQASLNSIIDQFEGTRPVATLQEDGELHVMHQEVINNGMFSSPGDDFFGSEDYLENDFEGF